MTTNDEYYLYPPTYPFDAEKGVSIARPHIPFGLCTVAFDCDVHKIPALLRELFKVNLFLKNIRIEPEGRLGRPYLLCISYADAAF